MRSTFKILFYINRQKTKTDGKTAIFCRVTINGNAAKDSRLAVCFCLLSVDVEQDLERTSHVGLWLNG